MSSLTNAFGQHGRALAWQGLRIAGRLAGLGVMAVCLATIPAELRFDAESGWFRIGAKSAMADDDGKGGGNGGANERSARPDREVGRDNNRGNARNERSERDDRASPSRGRAQGQTDRDAAMPQTGAAVAIGRVLAEQDDGPGTAPTEAGAARVRAMVEIAKELGARFPDRTGHPPVSGPVTQEMLDRAEEAYVAAVQDAWEAHGFPWTDAEVLSTVNELDALVSALEGIMQASARGTDGGAATTIAPDINDDGFVDINDLWDAHLR